MIWDRQIEEAVRPRNDDRPLHERASRGGIGRPTPKGVLLLVAGIIGGGIAAWTITHQPSSLLELLGDVAPHGGDDDRPPQEDSPDDPGVVYVDE